MHAAGTWQVSCMIEMIQQQRYCWGCVFTAMLKLLPANEDTACRCSFRGGRAGRVKIKFKPRNGTNATYKDERKERKRVWNETKTKQTNDVIHYSSGTVSCTVIFSNHFYLYLGERKCRRRRRRDVRLGMRECSSESLVIIVTHLQRAGKRGRKWEREIASNYSYTTPEGDDYRLGVSNGGCMLV